ncbi:atg6 [Candida theae]|uniref:Atg6 n=1 Tax=Candida theae TaxID=1198502 RepID=A0AAD5BAJ3_9ASCO|nr:atg6 [Candida theae]KAI5949248.1 atg6 [Candida theae]
MGNDQYKCGECYNPVQIDESLKQLNSSQLKSLINAKQSLDINAENELNPQDYLSVDKLKLYDQLPKQARPMVFKSYFDSEDEDSDEDEGNLHLANSNTSSDINSYLVVEEDHANESEQEVVDEGGFELRLSSRIKVLETIFNILSNTQDIEHPLGEDCANLLLENYQLKFDQSQKEKDQYVAFLRKLKMQDQKLNLHQENGEILNHVEDGNLDQSLSEFKNLKEVERDRLSELKKLENNRKELESELQSNKEELASMQHKVDDILRLRNELQLDLGDKQTKLEQLKASYNIHLNHIDSLRSSNIYKLMFDIKIYKKYAMINGFRIGYKIVLPEVNAALGQIVLLLTLITKRLDLKLIHYKLVPMGSQSHIVKFTDSENGTRQKKVLNLYSSDEFTLGRLFNFNKMDVAMIALLEIVALVETQLKKIDTELELPYRIYSGSENTSMELESGSFSIDVDNTPTRANYPALGEYNHCIIKRSNFRLINEGMIPRVLPEPRAGGTTNCVQSLQSTSTPSSKVNCIRSSPFVASSDFGFKRSSPMVSALPDDFAKSNEVYRHIYGSSSFIDSPFIHRNSSARSKLNQDCIWGVTPKCNNEIVSVRNTSARRSNASSVMSIESIMNPVSPVKKKRVEFRPSRGNEYYGVTLGATQIEDFEYGKDSDVQWREDFCSTSYKKHNQYDQFIVTIKLPHDFKSRLLALKKRGELGVKGNVQAVGVNKVGVTSSKRRGRRKREITKDVRHHQPVKAVPNKKLATEKQYPLEPPVKPLAKKAKSKKYDSDEEYIPFADEEFDIPRPKKRVKLGPNCVAKKRDPIVRSKHGCWTCRIRHKGCDEEQPRCGNCKRLNLECDFSSMRPDYMSNDKLHAAKLIEIRSVTDKIKRHGPKVVGTGC